jgi:hypothetical protein
MKPELPHLEEPEHVITCVYCGQAYPENTLTHGADVSVLTEHIRTCPKHPMREVEAKLAVAVHELGLVKEELSKARIALQAVNVEYLNNRIDLPRKIHGLVANALPPQ